MTFHGPARGSQSALLTDFYQLSMLDSYYRLGMQGKAVFEFFVRRLPENRSFMVAAGLEQVLDYLEELLFTAEDIDWLARAECVSSATLQRLREFRFSGRVLALPEGTVFFGSEPVLRVEASLPEAQLVGSRIVNLLQYQILVASKAARCRLAAPKVELVDFGMRRAHGAEAAVLCSRAGYIGGIGATATVEAARRYGIPLAGTMAHSFIQAHELETQAFKNFASCRPDNLILLIDTYDTAMGATRVVELAQKLRMEGARIAGVRIDSGDLTQAAAEVRRILDRGGCEDIRIIVSGGLDEYAIEAMQAARAPVDTYCLGTRLSVSDDAPSLDCAYKLQQYEGRPCRKLSQWKETWPGPRQVYRQYDASGYIGIDMLACEGEKLEGKPLLTEVMSDGRRLSASPPLRDVRDYCAEQLARLPPSLRSLERVLQAPVKVSPAQHLLAAQVAQVAH